MLLLVHCCSLVRDLVTTLAGAVAKYCNEHVCVSVCPRRYLPNRTRDLYHFEYVYSLWPWLGPAPVGDEILRRMENSVGLLPHWQCLVQHSIWDTYENG